MQGFVPPDPEGGVSKIQYAVIYIPKQSRKRFASNCVEIKASAEETERLNQKVYEMMAANCGHKKNYFFI